MPNFRPSSSYAGNNQSVPYKDTEYPSAQASQDMLQSYRRAAPPQEPQPRVVSNHFPTGPSSADAPAPVAPASMAAAPDPLTRAFNEAIKPYLEQINLLKNQLDDMKLQVQDLEDERSDMHTWIDKRGLRADVPLNIARAMDSHPDAATTLNFQLDRKMTMLNYDLHRLQDNLNDTLPTATFVQTLSTLIPDIERLAALRGGAKLAFELVIKLGGNLNSHGDGNITNEADSRSKAEFYSRIDETMVEVIRLRLEQSEEPPWQVARDVKRIERTGQYLKDNLGVQMYFPRSVDVLKYEAKRGEGQQGRAPGYSP
ncbi:MAG: hypothetical protein FRX48_06462 [Lasallia pustulata]|uniref:Uncharacterized protein n=1 Tax=Lasallia pustulata TaxID=136370 RepID=A0A5M8PLG4_9LECA|nr:MAG: hypothetical protein FRX48_06462 [Lasallia pustulata]